MYHEVATAERIRMLGRKTQRSFILPFEQFKHQMQTLFTLGFSTISLYDLFAHLVGKAYAELPPKPVIITFDDGFEGNFTNALPILKSYAFSATFFVVVNKIGSKFMMNYKQLKELVSNGMFVQSHSMSHPLLGLLNGQEITYQLKESKNQLESQLSSRVDFLSLPNGSYNKLYKKIANATGYKGGCTSEFGFVDNKCDPFFLKRIPIKREYDLSEFQRLVAGEGVFFKFLALKKNITKAMEQAIGELNYNRLYNFVYGVEEKTY